MAPKPRRPRLHSPVCARDDCENPENGRLETSDFGRAQHTYKCGTQASDLTCKHCRARQQRARIKAKKEAGIAALSEEPIKPVVDLSEFKHLAWDVKVANDVIRRPL